MLLLSTHKYDFQKRNYKVKDFIALGQITTYLQSWVDTPFDSIFTFSEVKTPRKTVPTVNTFL